jgi:regulator of sigma E protease
MVVIEFVLILIALMVIHEVGHFLAAKAFGIEVVEFGLGIPPRIATLFRWRETTFTLNAIPLGAFVLPKGENDPNIPGGLAAAPAWKRITVFFAGPAMNLILAVILYSVIIGQSGVPDPNKSDVV